MVSPEERGSALRSIVCLGFVSLSADMTYEGAYSIIGPFLKDLGASATQVGVIACLGEMIAASLPYFSGRFVDRTRAYWAVAISGYFLNVVVVPAMALAGNWKMAALLVVVERTGKVCAVRRATCCFRRPPARSATAGDPQARQATPPKIKQSSLPRVFWLYVESAGMPALGFVDFPLLAFHFERTQLVGRAMIPLLSSGAMGLNGLTALILGRLFDRHGIVVLSLGALVSLLALPLGFRGGTAAAIASVACWATGMGAQDACLRSGIAQVVSMNKRGSAFGAFNGYGIMWFVGSVSMGWLYAHSPAALVIFGMAAQLASAAMFFRIRGPQGAAANA